MTTPITYVGTRAAPTELAARLNHEVVATAANDSDAYPKGAVLTPSAVIPFTRPH